MVSNEFEGFDAHEIRIINRGLMMVKGVMHIESSDDQEVVLDTDLGLLIIRGDGLQIKSLNVQDGNCTLEGTMVSVQYTHGSGSRQKGAKSLFERLLR